MNKASVRIEKGDNSWVEVTLAQKLSEHCGIALSREALVEVKVNGVLDENRPLWEAIAMSGIFHGYRECEIRPHEYEVSIESLRGVIQDPISENTGIAIAASYALMMCLGRNEMIPVEHLEGWELVEDV